MTQTREVRGVATTIRKEYKTWSVQYHDTVVVKWDDKEITLDSGGWRTNTTKVRMNQASNQYHLGYQVYQKNHDWFVSFKDEVIPFTDGMVLTR